MITQSYTLSLQPGGFPVRVPCVQWDNSSRDITFHLVSGGTSFYPPDGAVVTIDGTKPDGKSFSVAGTVSSSDVTVSLTQQMTAVAGEVPCQLTITSDTAALGTARFILAVSAAAIPTDPDLSSSEMSAFESLKNAAAQSASAAAASEAAAAGNATAAAESAKQSAESAAAKVSTARLEDGAVTADKISDDFAGEWTPVITGASSYKGSGKYIKLGKMVVINFYLHSTFDKGVGSEAITITGCPFTPHWKSGGGGVLSGYNADDAVVFTGWELDTDGVISATGQTAEAGAGGKVSRTAIYPSAGVMFTACGTIAFEIN